MVNQRTGRPGLLSVLISHWPFYFGCAIAVVGVISIFSFFFLGRGLFHSATPSPDPDLQGYVTPDYASVRRSAVASSLFIVLVGVVLAVHGFLKCRTLVRNGIIVAGTVTTFHAIQIPLPATDVSYTYTIDRAVYTGRISVPLFEAKLLRVAPQVFLLVNPDNPKSHIRLSGYKVKEQQL
jgi:hypothetical protein